MAITMRPTAEVEVNNEPLTLDPLGTMYHNVPLRKPMSQDRRASSAALSTSDTVMTGALAMAVHKRTTLSCVNPQTLLHCTLASPLHDTLHASRFKRRVGGGKRVPRRKKGRGHPTVVVRGTRVSVQPHLFYDMLVPPAEAIQNFDPLATSLRYASVAITPLHNLKMDFNRKARPKTRSELRKPPLTPIFSFRPKHDYGKALTVAMFFTFFDTRHKQKDSDRMTKRLLFYFRSFFWK